MSFILTTNLSVGRIAIHPTRYNAPEDGRSIVNFVRWITPVLIVWTVAGPCPGIEIIAHRSALNAAPENTYAAAQKCIDWGVDYIEADVLASKDGVLYNLHDLTLNRTTNGKGLLASMRSKDVDTLDAGTWFAPEFAGERVPRYDTFLPWLKGKIKINLDVRTGDIEQLVKLIRDAGMAQECFLYFINDQMALKCHEIAPDLIIKMNVSTSEQAIRAATQYHAKIVEVPFPHLTPELIHTCRQHHLKIIACAHRNTAEEYRQILASGVDMVMLDRADLFLELAKDCQE